MSSVGLFDQDDAETDEVNDALDGLSTDDLDDLDDFEVDDGLDHGRSNGSNGVVPASDVRSNGSVGKSLDASDHLDDDEYADPDDLYWNDDQFVTIRPAWYRIGRGLIFLALILYAGLFVYRAGRGWFEAQLDPEGEPTTEVVLNVPNGATTADIGRILQDNEIIPNSTFFRYYAQYEGEGNFQAGEYTFQQNSSAGEAIEVLNLGPRPQEFARFTVREGLWIDEIIPEIAGQLDNVTEAELRAVLASGQIVPRYRPPGNTSWEGLFFPDTYEVNAEDDAFEVLLKMSDEFSEVSGELAYGAADTQLGYSAYEVLIVASLIEAETRVDSERPLVASVIYNRLREQWPLGIDATCIYGAGDRQVELVQSLLQDTENPYACRGRVGLPPTPINAPGRASLEAAIRPAESAFMYYVLTDPAGRHTFAETEEEFIVAKAICAERGLGCG